MFSRHRRLLSEFKERLRSEVSDGALARKVADLLARQCPRCKAPLVGHRYTLLAVASVGVAGNLERCERLLRALEAEEWETCAELSELGLEQDLLEVFLICCPDSKMSWVAVRSPVEYLVRAELVDAGLVSEGGQAGLLEQGSALSLEWAGFDS